MTAIFHDEDADVARAETIAKSEPGIAEARVFSKAEAERLLEPWLGSGLDLSDLPVPRLIALKLADDRSADLKRLRTRLEALLNDVTPAEQQTMAFDEVKALMLRLGLAAGGPPSGSPRDRGAGR